MPSLQTNVQLSTESPPQRQKRRLFPAGRMSHSSRCAETHTRGRACQGEWTCAGRAAFSFVGICETPFNGENDQTTWKIVPELDGLRAVSSDPAMRFRPGGPIHPLPGPGRPRDAEADVAQGLMGRHKNVTTREANRPCVDPSGLHDLVCPEPVAHRAVDLVSRNAPASGVPYQNAEKTTRGLAPGGSRID